MSVKTASASKRSRRKIPLKTAPAKTSNPSTNRAISMGTRSIPISMPEKQQATLFDLLALLTGNKNNRSDMARIIFKPYLDLIVSIMKADELMSDQNKFNLTTADALSVYDPANLTEEDILRNLEIFRKAQEANPQLNFDAIVRVDKLFDQKS